MSSLVREGKGRERRLLSSDLHHSVQPQESADHSPFPAVLSAQLLKRKKGECVRSDQRAEHVISADLCVCVCACDHVNEY